MEHDSLRLLSGWEPSAPRLTWYGAEGERVELSGRVLTTWVVKAGNLLTELGTGDGDRVLIDLPAHWRLLVWALAVRAVGAEIALPEGSEADRRAPLVVTAGPQRWSGGAAEVVAVPLAALALAWPGALPSGAVDGAADLMRQPDVPVFAAAPRPGDAAVTSRRLLVADDPATLVARAWAVWGDGGSVVVVTPRGAAEVAAIAAQEGVDTAAVAEPPS